MEGSITQFFLYCFYINGAILLLATLLLIVAKKPLAKMHASIFGINEDAVLKAYFRYLANYKIGILLFNLAPFIALLCMQ